jgi:hypothetical protein
VFARYHGEQHQRKGAVVDAQALAEQKHEEAVNYEKAIVELFQAADEDLDGNTVR